VNASTPARTVRSPRADVYVASSGSVDGDVPARCAAWCGQSAATVPDVAGVPGHGVVSSAYVVVTRAVASSYA
jgi:hypothetical protein